MSYANPNFIGDDATLDKSATLELGEKNGSTGIAPDKNQVSSPTKIKLCKTYLHICK